MTFDLEKVMESKRAMRRRLAALPVAEKLAMLDAMAERAQSFHAAHPATHSEITLPPESKPGNKL